MSFFPSLFGHQKNDTVALKTEIDKVFDNFFTEWPARWSSAENMKTFFSPAVDVAETKEGIEIKAELPDMNKEDIHLEVQSDRLVLSGEKKFEEEKQEDKGYHLVERRYGSFKRAIPLPFNIENHADIKANYDKGVLKVLVPRPANAKPDNQKININ